MNKNGKIEYLEFVQMFGLIKAMDKDSGKKQTKSSLSKKQEEVSGMSRMINNKLRKDDHPEVIKRLPIKPHSEDLFQQMSDGLIFIKLLNLLDKDAIDMRTINKYMPNMNKICMTDNINQALTAASGLIKVVGVNDQAFVNRSETIILGVLT